MKIVLTGSLGNISKPLTKKLVKQGHSVTVISSKKERQKEIEEIGAKSAIGTMEDSEFLSSTFKGADVVYLMESLGSHNLSDKDFDMMDIIRNIGNIYKKAIQESNVKRVIHLSSIGGHTDKGNGILSIHCNVENILRELPEDVSIKFMRPVGFYYNMFSFIQSIKTKNSIISNYGGDEKEPWVSPLDIADVIVEEIEKPFDGRTIRYIASDEVSPNEVSTILGEAIGKNDLKWLQVSDEQFMNGLLLVGMNQKTAKGFVEMNISRVNGILYEDYYKNKPILGKLKLTDFAKEFAIVYNSK